MRIFPLLVAIAGAWLVAARFAGAFNWAAVAVLALIGAVPGLLWLMVHPPGGAAARVAGGRAEIRLFDDRLEVPGASAERGVDVFPLADLEIAVSQTSVSVNFVVTSTFRVAELRAGSLERRISSRVFESEAAFASFLHDVEHVRHRLPVAPPEADDYDERLDRELDALE